MALCMHLLRLRPTVQQLRSWNKDAVEPYKTLDTRGWTAFLRELTPASILEGLGPKVEPDEKLERRQKIMDDMYDVAEKEEGFLRGERGSCLIFFLFFPGVC